MPFDGTELAMFEDHPLAKLGKVERLLAGEQQWCKGKLRDSDGRHCLVGAMQAVEARQALEPIVLRAAKEIGGKHYWRIEFFNDDPRTTHADILRVLRLARENIIAGMVEADRGRGLQKRLAQALHALCSCFVSGICAAFRFGLGISSPVVAKPAPAPLERRVDAPLSMARESCEVL